MIKLVFKAIFFAILGFSLNIGAVTREHYQQAVSFTSQHLYNKTALNLNTAVNWFSDDSGLWFIDYRENGKHYKTVAFKDGRVKDLFDHKKLADTLTQFKSEKVTPYSLELSNIERLSSHSLSFTYDNQPFRVSLNDYKLMMNNEHGNKDSASVDNEFESISPDGRWIAYTKNYNLFIKSSETGEEYPLSSKGEKDYEYAAPYNWFDKMEGENGDRPKRFFVNWSDDSKWLSTNIVDTRDAEKMYLLDWSKDELFKPKLLSYYRGSPGDTNMVRLQPVFFNVESKKEVETSLPTNTHINSVGSFWTQQSGQLIASYSERGFLKRKVKLVDLNNNSETTLIEETSDTSIDNFWSRYLEDAQKMVFLSERSGWRQLYLHDISRNQTQALTDGNFYINSVEFIDETNETLYFLASGKESQNNPYHQQLYKVTFKGEISLVTPENTHHIVSFSNDGKYFVDNYSTVQIPTITVLRKASTGQVVTQLTQADVSRVVKIGWQAPQVFDFTAKDGKTTLYGALWKPTHFDPNKSYPIIDVSYTGPHTQLFPKSFDGAFAGQALAELGFIVMRVDGLGTAGRSKAFHDHSYKNMGSNLDDHVLAIKYLANQYSWIDDSRVGIYGHSAGGYDTGRALLAYSDVYKVGVASSGDHDFRMEKAWWPEMYQGWPVDETYHDVSNITNASNLKGKLLLVHGGLDDNVNPSATFKFAEALIKADKEFDLLILPSQRHGYSGNFRLYFTKKRWNYFVEHLLNEDPIWDFKWNPKADENEQSEH